jgi:ABC-2 type transport system ATP-binding protein
VSSTRIQFENVTHRYRLIRERPDSLREIFAKLFQHRSVVQDFEALKALSFQIGSGETVGLIGRNGSGKSTALKIMAGVFEPTQGQVSINGTIAPLIELGAGFHPDLTGRENILLNGLLMGVSKKELLARAPAIIEFAELGDFIDTPLKQYSSGMYMRLAFATAVEVDPDILLVDEILAVGDAEFQEKCYERMRQFQRRGKTLVLVSHFPDDIRKLCSRTILIDHGQLIADGSTESVLRKYEELIHLPVPVHAVP